MATTMTDPLVHYVGWASQPDLQVFCNEEMTTPAWGLAARERKKLLPPGIFLAENGEVYTFDISRVTCPKCRSKHAVTPGSL